MDCPLFAGLHASRHRPEHGAKRGQTRLARGRARWGQSPFRNPAQIEGDDAAAGDYLYHTHDHLGSTRQVYDQAKDLAASFDYTPYGRELMTTNRALTTRGYTGHTREAALGGGYYAPYRYYLPNLARWEKRDPLGMVDGPNVYAYVRGNPVNLWDPMGLLPKGCCQRGLDEAKAKDPEFDSRHDKYKHCVVGCEIYHKCGLTAVRVCAAAKECYDYVSGSGTPEWEDYTASVDGGKKAKESPSLSCKALCRQTYSMDGSASEG